MWIGKKESANQILMKDPSLMEESARIFSSFPGGQQEGFPDTSKHFSVNFIITLQIVVTQKKRSHHFRHSKMDCARYNFVMQY